MQLNITTDYAIRIVLYAAIKGTVVTSVDISETMHIPRAYVITMTKRLRDVGIINAERGKNGGYVLARHPKDISLLEIINTMEGTTRINRCLEDDGFCSRDATPYCQVHKHYTRLQKLIDDYLSGVTIEKLMNDSK